MHKLFIYFVLTFVIYGCKGQLNRHPMPNIGVIYVRQTHHMDSFFRFSAHLKWNDTIKMEIDRQFKLDSVDDLIYRAKYHFNDYYYMWNYTDPERDSEGWGENDIILDHSPTEKEIKDYVWNTCFSPKERREYNCLEITSIEVESSSPNTLQNMSIKHKAELQHGRSTYKLLQ